MSAVGTQHTAPALPTAVLFDLDGTLSDSEPFVAAALQRTLQAFGYHVTQERVIEELGPPLQPMLETLAQTRFDPAQLDAMREEYLRHYNATLAQIEPLPGAVALLDALRARGVPIALVTNKREDGAHEQLAAMGWTDRFATVIGADTAGAPKPDAAPAREALRRLGAGAAHAAFVGDMEPDMECASAAGLPWRIGYTRARTPDALRSAGATHLCAHLDEVAAVLLGNVP